jgi:copper chaperone CopZ
MNANGAKTGKLVTTGAAVAAILSSACCWLPLLLIGFGVSAGGVAAVFDAYRTPLLVGTGVLLSTAFYFSYRPPKACALDGSCATPKRKAMRMNHILLWATTVLVVGFTSFPSWMRLVVDSGEAAASVAASETTEVRYAVEGMHCEGCKGLLEAELMTIPGVVAANVVYDEKLAVVRVRNGTSVSVDAVAKAGQEVGFTVRPSE